MDARNLGGDAGEGSAAGPARLGIPRFKLARRAAKPQENAMFLGFFCLRRKERILKQARKTRQAGQRAARQPFDEKPPVQPMLVHAALA